MTDPWETPPFTPLLALPPCAAMRVSILGLLDPLPGSELDEIPQGAFVDYFALPEQTAEEKKAAARRYYERNRARLIAMTRGWQREHPEQVNATRRARRLRNLDAFRERERAASSRYYYRKKAAKAGGAP